MMSRSLTTPLLTFALTLCSAGALLAQPATDGDAAMISERDDDGARKGKHRGKRGRGAKHMKRLFGKLDVNQDGVLTAEELGERAQRAARFDTNGDGSITKDEVRATVQAQREKLRAMTPEERQAFREARKAERAERRAERWKQKDTDGDGRLSAAEAPRAVERFDTNGDGFVTQDEIAAVKKQKRGQRMERKEGRKERRSERKERRGARREARLR